MTREGAEGAAVSDRILRDDECGQCLEMRPLLYRTVFVVLDGISVQYLCSACRMAHDRHPTRKGEEFVTVDYIWDHKMYVRASGWLSTTMERH